MGRVMLRIRKITEFAHFFLRQSVGNGEKVIDATAGNGFDTLFLAELVGTQGRVFAFDIQCEALSATKNKLSKSGLDDRVTLIHDGHEKLNLYVTEPIAAVVYNLGFLPGGDKSNTTKTETTLNSLGKALSLLKSGGLAVLLLYPGHSEGKKEKVKLLKYCRNLSPQTFTVQHFRLLNVTNNPPELLVIQRNLSVQTCDG